MDNVKTPLMNISLKTLNKFLIILICFSFFGCASKMIDIRANAVNKTKLNITSPEPLSLEKIKWIVITSENADDIFKKLSDSNTDMVLLGLSDEDYENLSLNFLKIRKYLSEQKMIIESYQEYYESWEEITETDIK